MEKYFKVFNIHERKAFYALKEIFLINIPNKFLQYC